MNFHIRISARAKKIASTSATPQTASPEHRPSTSRGSRAGVSQSQRKYHFIYTLMLYSLSFDGGPLM